MPDNAPEKKLATDAIAAIQPPLAQSLTTQGLVASGPDLDAINKMIAELLPYLIDLTPPPITDQAALAIIDGIGEHSVETEEAGLAPEPQSPEEQPPEEASAAQSQADSENEAESPPSEKTPNTPLPPGAEPGTAPTETPASTPDKAPSTPSRPPPEATPQKTQNPENAGVPEQKADANTTDQQPTDSQSPEGQSTNDSGPQANDNTAGQSNNENTSANRTTPDEMNAPSPDQRNNQEAENQAQSANQDGAGGISEQQLQNQLEAEKLATKQRQERRDSNRRTQLQKQLKTLKQELKELTPRPSWIALGLWNLILELSAFIDSGFIKSLLDGIDLFITRYWYATQGKFMSAFIDKELKQRYYITTLLDGIPVINLLPWKLINIFMAVRALYNRRQRLKKDIKKIEDTLKASSRQ